MATTFASLPAELLCTCSDLLDNKSLKSLRLCSKELCNAATMTLFGRLFLYPTEESAENYLKILSTPELSKYVRSVCLNTEEKDFKFEVNAGESDLPEFFMEALQKTKDFPNLCSVTVRFDEACWVERDWYSPTYAESTEFRAEVLYDLFSMLNDTRGKIRSLTFENLQNVNDPSIAQSPMFKEVLQKLDTLQLFIISECDEAAPENSYTLTALHAFMQELPSVWLSHTTRTLSNLTLSMDDYFGYVPLLDLRGTHFSSLRSLTLRHFSFSHDWQVDWIISHAPTLHHLTLDSCVILYNARVFPHMSPLNAESIPVFPKRQPATGRGCPPPMIYKNSRRWHEYFDRFAAELRNLRTIRFGTSDCWDDESNPLEDAFYICIPVRSYLCFEQGIGPTPWQERISNRRRPNAPDSDPPDCAKDWKSLLRLMERLGQPLMSGTGKIEYLGHYQDIDRFCHYPRPSLT